MSLPPVPQSAAQYISQAAQATGLPESVVAAQNYVESGYGTNDGPSSAGANGPWQFIASTWASNSSAPYSQADNWATSTAAYSKLMTSLLKQYNGNISDALAAYNAGPGDLSAGKSYASEILALADQSTDATIAAGASTGSAGTSSVTTGNSAASASTGITIPGLGTIPLTGLSTILDVFTTLDTILKDIISPAFWVRIAAFFAGIALLIAGIWCLIRASDNSPLMPSAPSVMPVPI